MTRKSQTGETHGIAEEPPTAAPGDSVLARLRALPPDAEERTALLRRRIGERLAAGDRAGATEAAERLSRLPGQPEAPDLVIETALEMDDLAVARDALAEAEASGRLSPSRTACLKARIALETGDHAAAKAILVTAIDRAPDLPQLRSLLAEVMVAGGTAAEARAVLNNLGRSPVNPPPSVTGPDGAHRASAPKADRAPSAPPRCAKDGAG
jgi:predicted Zn-dependent protease